MSLPHTHLFYAHVSGRKPTLQWGTTAGLCPPTPASQQPPRRTHHGDIFHFHLVSLGREGELRGSLLWGGSGQLLGQVCIAEVALQGLRYLGQGTQAGESQDLSGHRFLFRGGTRASLLPWVPLSQFLLCPHFSGSRTHQPSSPWLLPGPQPPDPAGGHEDGILWHRTYLIFWTFWEMENEEGERSCLVSLVQPWGVSYLLWGHPSR